MQRNKGRTGGSSVTELSKLIPVYLETRENLCLSINVLCFWSTKIISSTICFPHSHKNREMYHTSILKLLPIPQFNKISARNNRLHAITGIFVLCFWSDYCASVEHVDITIIEVSDNFIGRCRKYFRTSQITITHRITLLFVFNLAICVLEMLNAA